MNKTEFVPQNQSSNLIENLTSRSNGSTSALSTPGSNYQVLWFAITLITTMFGVFSNFLLLLTLFIHKPLRKSLSWALITHMCLLNLYLTAVTVPMNTIPIYLGPGHRFPPNFCRYQALYIYFVYGVGTWAESFIALQRLAASISPPFFALIIKRSFTVIMMAVSWIVGMALYGCAAAEYGVKFVRSKATGGCSFISTGIFGWLAGLKEKKTIEGLKYRYCMTLTFRL